MRPGNLGILILLIMAHVMLAAVVGVPWSLDHAYGSHPFVAMWSLLVATILFTIVMNES